MVSTFKRKHFAKVKGKQKHFYKKKWNSYKSKHNRKKFSTGVMSRKGPYATQTIENFFLRYHKIGPMKNSALLWVKAEEQRKNLGHVFPTTFDFYIMGIEILSGVLIKHGKAKLAMSLFHRFFKLVDIYKFNYPANAFISDLSSKDIFLGAIQKLNCEFRLVSKRVGGVVYRLPKFIPSERKRVSIVIHSLVRNSLARKEGSIVDCMARECIESYLGISTSYKQIQTMREIASNNRGFVRFLNFKKK